MAVFSKELSNVRNMDPAAAVNALSQYIRYMTESIEFAVTSQSSMSALQSQIGEIKTALQTLDARITALEGG